jgi:hypothetical protein
MIRNISTFMATVLPIVAFALTPSAAMAQSYSGNWPATVTHSQHSNGTYCLTLTDNGTLGWPHSGPASLPGGSGGSFQLINGTLVVTIEEEGGTGQNAGLVFSASASHGDIGKGVYEDVFAGEEFDSGVLVFGVKNGC